MYRVVNDVPPFYLLNLILINILCLLFAAI